MPQHDSLGHLFNLFVCCGPPGRDRTCDPRLKRALLYQLSYGRKMAKALERIRMVGKGADEQKYASV
jgi:hypothetical protein